MRTATADLLDYDPRFLPVPYRRFRRLTTTVAGGLALAGIAIWAWALDIPQKTWFALAQGVADLGLQVDNIHVAGLRNTPKLAVYAAVLAQNSNSMLLVDIDDIRARVQAIPTVESATVARRLPNTLEITVRERQPAAVWQQAGRLALLDSEGRVIDRVTPQRYAKLFAQLPLVVGARAEFEAPHLWAMLKTQPDLKAKLRAAMFISGRRWDLLFDTGETLSLPEGVENSARAYGKFAELQSRVGLLGRGFARFDMRLDDRMVVRRSPSSPANYNTAPSQPGETNI